ncbi:ESIP1 protein, partial [Podargus strigoides]|nr:ESIP1 protein [Podargus strigoides]
GPYVMITPNKTRRNQLQQSKSNFAKKELHDLEQWKEGHRPGPIKVIPQRLGGKESEAQARQKQQMMLMQSKYQRKHKREEYIKAKKAAEEAEILEKNSVQREKVNMGRIKSCIYFYGSTNNSLWIGFFCSKPNELLSRLDVGLPKSDSCQIANHGPKSTSW